MIQELADAIPDSLNDLQQEQVLQSIV